MVVERKYSWVLINCNDRSNVEKGGGQLIVEEGKELIQGNNHCNNNAQHIIAVFSYKALKKAERGNYGVLQDLIQATELKTANHNNNICTTTKSPPDHNTCLRPPKRSPRARSYLRIT